MKGHLGSPNSDANHADASHADASHAQPRPTLETMQEYARDAELLSNECARQTELAKVKNADVRSHKEDLRRFIEFFKDDMDTLGVQMESDMKRMRQEYKVKAEKLLLTNEHAVSLKQKLIDRFTSEAQAHADEAEFYAICISDLRAAADSQFHNIFREGP